MHKSHKQHPYDDYNVVYANCSPVCRPSDPKLHSVIPDLHLSHLGVEMPELPELENFYRREKDFEWDFKRISSSISTISSSSNEPCKFMLMKEEMGSFHHKSCPNLFSSDDDVNGQGAEKETALRKMQTQETITSRYDRQLKSRKAIERALLRIVQGTRTGFVTSPFSL